MTNKTAKVKTVPGRKLGERSHSRLGEPLNPVELRYANRIASVFQNALVLPEFASEYYDHGYRSGELHESNLWQIAAGVENARPFSVRESVTIPDLHIGLLIDCSASMFSGSDAFREDGRPGSGYFDGWAGATTMHAARTLALGMAKAFDSIKGVHLTIAGHTEFCGEITMLLIKRARASLNASAFSNFAAMGGNLDGLAVMALSREMAKDMKPGETGALFLISDGAPCHSPEIMDLAFKRSKNEHGITVFPIAVGRDLDEEICREIYNNGPYVLAPDVLSSTPEIVRTVNRIVGGLKPM